MEVLISKSKDVEELIRSILAKAFTAYCPPLPAEYTTPCLLVQSVGGSSDASSCGAAKIDHYTVTVDSRANTEVDALDCLQKAVALLESKSGTELSHVAVNSLYSWGSDPVRPDLAMCSATIIVTTHRDEVTLNVEE